MYFREATTWNKKDNLGPNFEFNQDRVESIYITNFCKYKCREGIVIFNDKHEKLDEIDFRNTDDVNKLKIYFPSFLSRSME